MGRIIGAVVVGYLVMVLLIFGTFTLAYLNMGADGAFKPSSYDATPLWLATSFAWGITAAVVGGFTCAAIAKRGKAPSILAGLVLVLGLLMAIPAITAAPDKKSKVRDEAVSNMDAMMNAVQPTWVVLLNPFLGAAGTLLGASFKRRGGPS